MNLSSQPETKCALVTYCIKHTFRSKLEFDEKSFPINKLPTSDIFPMNTNMICTKPQFFFRNFFYHHSPSH